jgi:hypothetical protein
MMAYSESTGVQYPSWEALVRAEANGYVAVAIVTRGKRSWPWVVGPWPTRRVALNKAAALRRELKRVAREHPSTTFTVSVRPSWKEPV